MNLLVITDRFPHKYDHSSAAFVKELIKAQTKYFDKIFVISLNPWLPKFIAKKMKNPRWYKDSVAQSYAFDNVEVYFLKYPSLPFKSTIVIRDRFAWYFGKRIIKNIFSKKKISLIHAHFIHPSGSLATRIKRIYQIPLVITGHGHDVRVYPYFNTSLRNKILNTLLNSDAMITVSYDNAKKLRNIGYTKEIYVIPNGYDPALFKPMDKKLAKKKINLPLDRKIIVSVGRIDNLKGYNYLIDAIEILKKQNMKKLENLLLIIIGDGPSKSNIIKRIKEKKLEKYIKLVGETPHELIPYYINSSEFFILPSLDEGNPTVMFESLGCGIPFIGTAVGGVPEIITSEDYGFLCPPKDPECLAEKILIALEKDWDREKIRKYAEQFTWEEIAKKTLEIYKKLDVTK